MLYQKHSCLWVPQEVLKSSLYFYNSLIIKHLQNKAMDMG